MRKVYRPPKQGSVDKISGDQLALAKENRVATATSLRRRKCKISKQTEEESSYLSGSRRSTKNMAHSPLTFNDTTVNPPGQATRVTKIRSKVNEPQLYEEAINEPVYGCRWREAIETELDNLAPLDTWEYRELPQGR